jgi:hypothetical protein
MKFIPEFTAPNKVLLVLGHRTGAHREDWNIAQQKLFDKYRNEFHMKFIINKKHQNYKCKMYIPNVYC